MNLTNNKIEQLIMEVLNENKNQEYEIDGIRFKIVSGDDFSYYKDKILDSTRMSDKGKIKKTAKMTNLDKAQSTALVDAYKAGKKITKATNTPPAFNLAKFKTLINDVDKAATGTDQTIVDAAKTNLDTYYKSFQSAADAEMSNDATLKADYDKAVAAKAKFNFSNFQTELGKVSSATDLSTLTQAIADLNTYYTANQAVIDGNPAEKAKYDAVITSVPAKKKAIQNAAFKKKIDDAKALAANTSAGETSLKASKQDLIDTNTNNTSFQAYVTANQADYDQAIDDLDKAIDLIVNKWKQDPLASLDVDSSGLVDPGSVDANRQQMFKDLQSAFGSITAAEIKQIAELSESVIKEDVNKFEIDDIEALFNLEPQFTAKGGLKKTLSTTNDPKTQASKKEIDLATKVRKAIDSYINAFVKTSPNDKASLRKLIAAKKKYLQLSAKSKKARLSTRNKFIQIDAISPAQINQLNARSKALGIKKMPLDGRTLRTFNDFFEGTTNLKSRINKLQDFSNKIDAGGFQATDDAGDLYSGAALINMLSMLSRAIDGSAGGFYMEGFLAALIGGEKTGGSQGAGDFVGADGTNYSSKFGLPTYVMKQASSNFNNANEKVTYVCAHRLGTGLSTTATGAAGTQETVSLKIGVFTVETIVANKQFKLYSGFGTSKSNQIKFGNNSVETGNIYYTSNKIASHPGFDGSDFVFGSIQNMISNLKSSDVYTVKFLDTTAAGANSTFDEKFSKAVDNSNNLILKTAKDLNNTISEIKKGSVNFLRDKDMGSAFTMAEEYRDLKGKIQALYDAVFMGSGFDPAKGTSTRAQRDAEYQKYVGALQESKLQTLDNLIAEVMRDIKKIK